LSVSSEEEKDQSKRTFRLSNQQEREKKKKRLVLNWRFNPKRSKIIKTQKVGTFGKVGGKLQKDRQRTLDLSGWLPIKGAKGKNFNLNMK